MTNTTRRFQAPERLRDETEPRALLEAVFDALHGRVVAADACYERIVRGEAVREPTGERTLVPWAVKSGLGLRLVGEGGRRLNLSIGDVEPRDAMRRLGEALDLLPHLAPDPELSLAPLPDRTPRHFAPERFTDPRDLDLTAAFGALLDQIEAEAAALTPEGTQLRLRVRAYVQVEDKIVADVDGLWRTQTLPQVFLQVEGLAQREGRRARYVARWGDLGGPDTLLDAAGKLRPAPLAAVRAGLEKAVVLLAGRALSPAEVAELTHLILDPSAMTFIHEAEGHNFEADLIRSGASGLFHADGTPVDPQLGSPCVRLIDGPAVDAAGAPQAGTGFGTHFIDDEGVEVQPVVLLDRGRVAGRLHNRETAGHFGESPNGRGFSELGEERLVRMTNTCLLPADDDSVYPDQAALLKGIRLGVWLEGSHGGEVNAEGMTSSIQAGRLIRNGRLTDEWLLPCSFTVRTRGALKTVEGFHGAPRCDRPGFCGKGQTKTVSEGGCVARLAASDALLLAW